MYTTSTKSARESSFIKKYPLIFKKFRPLKYLSKGAFSEIYLGINIFTKEKVAIKIEEKYAVEKSLEKECYFLFNLKALGIPKVISFGHNKEYDILVLPLLGKSLHEIQMSKNFNFEFKDICLIAIQIIERIQWIHSQKIVHRDIKPDNFLIGLNDPNIIYIIDFGLSKKYRSSTTGNHIKYTKLKRFVGSVRYASVNALKLREQSRKDDLESIGYMLIYLIKRKLPWDNIRIDNKRSSYLKLSEYKKNIQPELLCCNLPYEFIEYVRYVKNLKFEDEPDYNYLRSLFQIMLNKQGFEENKVFFSWINVNNINRIQKVINLSKRNSSSRGRILNKIKKSMDYKRSISEMHNIINSRNIDANDDDKYQCNIKKNIIKKILDDNPKNININRNNYENKPIINNYIYNYISPTNNINNKQYQNLINFTSYNPFVIKSNENIFNNSFKIRNNLRVNYNPVVSPYNINNNDYKMKNNTRNYEEVENNDLKNLFINKSFCNNYNVKVMNQPNKNCNVNNVINLPYRSSNIINKKPNIQQNINTNKYNAYKIPLSYINSNINNINIEKPNSTRRFKNFKFWNISPFKKRNNLTQINKKNNNNMRIDNNFNQIQLKEEIKKFNNKYNIKLGKNDKIFIKNKKKKVKNLQLLPINKSADTNNFNHLQKKHNNFRNNTDKNCYIF